jgi:hypothetical protein
MKRVIKAKEDEKKREIMSSETFIILTYVFIGKVFRPNGGHAKR